MKRKKCFLYAVIILFFSVNILGYIVGRSIVALADVHDREAAKVAMEESQTEREYQTSSEELKHYLGKTLVSIYHSWDDRGVAKIFVNNSVITILLGLTCVIPITFIWAAYRLVTSALFIGMAMGIDAATGGSHLKFVLSMPHLFLEVPVIIYVTYLSLRCNVLIIGSIKSKRTKIAAKYAYSLWLRAIPILLILLFLSAIIEAKLTPYLVHRFIAI